MIIDTSKPISIKQFGRVSQQKGNWHNGKTMPFHLFLFVEKGSFKMKIDKKTVICNEKDLIAIPQGTYYRPLDSQGTIYCFFQVIAETCDAPQNETNVVLCSKYTKKIRLTPDSKETDSYNFNHFSMNRAFCITVNTVTHCIDNIPIQKIIQRLSSLNIKNNSNNILLAEAFFREILIIASNELNENRYQKKLNDILEYINHNYHENLTLSTLSKTFSVSDSYIARMFKTRLGMTPSEYINTVRIESACNLLLNSKMKIGDIAYKTGFYSPYYFSRVFKKIHGITPGGFRKNEQIMNP